MNLFLSKKEKEQRRIEEQKQKEVQTRIRIKQTLNKMKNQSSKLDEFKQSYIENAKKAALTGNTETYKMAKTGLKICLTKQKYLDQMIANFELSLQVADMNKVVTEFFSGINMLSEQMQEVTSGLDMSKAQLAYEKALANNESQYDALSAFLSTAGESIESINGSESSVSDEEIDKLISIQAADSVDAMDRDIENTPAEQIQDIQVLETVFMGKTVFRKA